MKTKAPSKIDAIDSADEAELWFLPGPSEDDPPSPGPRPFATPIFDPAEWRAAEAGLAADLAALAHDAGRLDERLSRMGDGARLRLALQEAASLGWWTGDRIGADQLTLWLTLHLAGAGDAAQALSRLAWVVRRLTAPLPPSRLAPASMDWMQAELGLSDSQTPPERCLDAAEALEGMEPLHRVTRACVLFHAWRLSGEEAGRQLEAVTLAQRLAGGRAGFLPLTLAGFGALSVSGRAERRLAGWIAGAHQAVLAALLHLERLHRWQDTARRATEDLSGRTPARLIDTLARLPMLSAPVAEAETGASRAAVQRNLDRLAAKGLIREITGQGRFRVWTARL